MSTYINPRAWALFTLLSLLTTPNAMARSAGMDIAADGASLHYIGAPVERKRGGRWGHYTPTYRLHYAQATAPRNLLLSADAEFHRFSKTIAGNYQLHGKTYLLGAEYHDQRLLALGFGGLLRTPPRKRWPVTTQLEVFGAPQATTLFRGNYVWGVTLQGDYPLPNDNALIVGFRKIKMGVNDVSDTSYQNSVYFGLTSHF